MAAEPLTARDEHRFTPPPLRPIGSSERSRVMDALRGFAVLGILAMNIPFFAFPESDFFNPRVGGIDGSDGAAYVFCRLVFDMKMQSLFSMLFGAGVVVLGERAVAAGRSLTPLFLRRVGVLAIFGILHAYLLWYGDILWTYAVCGLFIFPLRKLRAPWLLTIGLLAFLLGAVISHAMGAGMWFFRAEADRLEALVQAGESLKKADEELLQAWLKTRSVFSPSEETLAAERAAHLGGYIDVVKHRAPSALDFQIGPMFWSFSLWRFAGYMLIGAACMRWGVFTGKLSNRAYALMALVGYAIGLPLVYFGYRDALAHDFDFVRTFLTGWQWNYLGSAFVAFGHVGALTLLFNSPLFSAVTSALAAAGRMALTNYITQSVLCGAIFFGWGLGYWGSLSRTEVFGVVLGIWALQIVWSLLWLSRFRMGPMEWLWRTMTYLKAPAMRR